MFVHGRILRPFLGLNLLFMSLPLVLGGYGRNTFINLGFAMGNSALFYGAILFCQYLGSFDVLSPAMSAWAPVASLRNDRDRAVGADPDLNNGEASIFVRGSFSTSHSLARMSLKFVRGFRSAWTFSSSTSGTRAFPAFMDRQRECFHGAARGRAGTGAVE